MAARWTEEQQHVTYARIIELRRDHLEFEEIGRQLWEAGEWPGNLPEPPSKSAVWQQWRRALKSIPAPALAELRSELMGQFEELYRKANEVLDRDHLAHSNGQVVYGPSGKAVIDDGPKLAAIGQMQQLLAKMAVLGGANAPVQQKVIMDASIKYEVVGVDTEALK